MTLFSLLNKTKSVYQSHWNDTVGILYSPASTQVKIKRVSRKKRSQRILFTLLNGLVFTFPVKIRGRVVSGSSWVSTVELEET